MDKEYYLKKSKIFCMKPWVHLYIRNNGDVSPCSISNYIYGNINEKSIKDIWQGEKIREFRKNMFKDKNLESCNLCYEKEYFGIISSRNKTNGFYPHKFDWVENTTIDGFSKLSKPINLDIRLSNVCNLKCRQCSHIYSSSWYDEALILDSQVSSDKIIKATENIYKFCKQLEEFLPETEFIYFAGGEPIIMDGHYYLLQMIEDNSLYNMVVSYSTNFSILKYKDLDFLTIWSKLKKLEILASLDASDKKGEYLRKGLNWQEVLVNRKLLKEEVPNATFIICPTVNVFSLLSLPEFHKECISNNMINKYDIYLNILQYPKYYSIQILPESMKIEADIKIREHILWLSKLDITSDEELNKKNQCIRMFDECIKYMNSSDETKEIPYFIEICNKLDKLRNESTIDVFPELKPVFDLGQVK